MNAKAHYFFEIYTDDGAEIVVGFVLHAGSRERAVARLKAKFGSRMGDVIQCHESLLFPIDGPKTILRGSH